MRAKIVSGLLLCLFVASFVMMLAREKPPHQAPAPPALTASASPSASPSGSSAPVASASASGSAAAAGSASATPPDAGPEKLFERPLRVIALGWDLAAPGVLANGGLDGSPASAFTAAGVETRVAATDSMSVVEGALARGGADKDGADVAIVPLCQFVASYERLRALAPEMFFVVGWSRGREALISSKDALPVAGDAKEVKMAGAPGETATFLGLFALDAAGIPASAVRLVVGDPKPDEAPLAAVDRDASAADTGRRNILLTTADASRLVPFVAIAPHGLLDKGKRALAAWARVWLDGTKRLQSDAPGAARQIAGAPGAPEPIALLKRLGEIGHATLTDNARVAGLSGRGAVTLESLFQRSFRIWRAAGLLAIPAPEAAPVATSVIAALVRSNPEMITPSPATMAPASGKGPTNLEALRVMIPYRQPDGKLDEAELVTQAALFADMFERSSLRVAILRAGGVDTAATKKLIDNVEERFDIAGGRLAVAKKGTRGAASIDVLAAP